MNITKEQVDALNAVVTVKITKDDYKQQVEKVMADYRKNASIPGFRKGAVPMSLIQKQYGKPVLLEEVNKLLQSSLNNFLAKEKLDILGNPLPRMTEDFNWDADDYTFEFELGLAPQFTVDLDAKNTVTKFNITADDAMIDEQVARIQKQYGKLISKNEIEEGDDITGTFTNEEKGIENTVTITTDIFADKEAANKFLGKKVGDVVTLSTKGLFDD
ncbi:MAG: trigger factor family protein, partial [Flavobacterium sp.]